ncbi:uncharacterized protein PO1_contig-068-10 [Mycobacterium sp. PO1]|nr:uncharacterized protein PO1_contig-068-10 [Mycobacterium sp. PO1]GFM27056.1 uncharacterized protein PO2_contig-143-5 [Mycobacterium sp. PO2]
MARSCRAGPFDSRGIFSGHEFRQELKDWAQLSIDDALALLGCSDLSLIDCLLHLFAAMLACG